MQRPCAGVHCEYEIMASAVAQLKRAGDSPFFQSNGQVLDKPGAHRVGMASAAVGASPPVANRVTFAIHSPK
jgi:hypothetical protein